VNDVFGIPAPISPNVLAVGDGFAARISKPQVCRATKLWVKQGVGASEATDLALR